jgi:hypothetical protein
MLGILKFSLLNRRPPPIFPPEILNSTVECQADECGRGKKWPKHCMHIWRIIKQNKTKKADECGTLPVEELGPRPLDTFLLASTDHLQEVVIRIRSRSHWSIGDNCYRRDASSERATYPSSACCLQSPMANSSFLYEVTGSSSYNHHLAICYCL